MNFSKAALSYHMFLISCFTTIYASFRKQYFTVLTKTDVKMLNENNFLV